MGWRGPVSAKLRRPIEIAALKIAPAPSLVSASSLRVRIAMIGGMLLNYPGPGDDSLSCHSVCVYTAYGIHHQCCISRLKVRSNFSFLMVPAILATSTYIIRIKTVRAIVTAPLRTRDITPTVTLACKATCRDRTARVIPRASRRSCRSWCRVGIRSGGAHRIRRPSWENTDLAVGSDCLSGCRWRGVGNGLLEAL
jgi:hypothetical protein